MTARMDDYWKAPTAELPEEVEELEEPYEESGRPGCLSVFAVLLAVSGIVYGIIFGALGIDLIVEQPDRPAVGALVTVCATAWLPLPVIVAIGLWRMKMWAWWLMVIVQSLGISLALLGFVVALLGIDPMRALGFVLGPLMGLVASGIILYWFLSNRERFGDDEVAYVGGRAEEKADADNALLIFAVTAIGCIALFCVAVLAVVFLIFALGGVPPLSEIMRSLGLPAR